MSSYIVFYQTSSVDYIKKYPQEQVGTSLADDHNQRKDLFTVVAQCLIEADSEEDAENKFNDVYDVSNDKTSDLKGNEAIINEVGNGVFIKAVELTCGYSHVPIIK